jgi:hypothetical protein
MSLLIAGGESSLRHTAFTCKGFSAECLGNVNLVLALVVAADLRIG